MTLDCLRGAAHPSRPRGGLRWPGPGRSDLGSGEPWGACSGPHEAVRSPSTTPCPPSASPCFPTRVTVWKGALRVFPRLRGDSPTRARRLAAAAKPLQLGGGKRLGDAQGCPPRARLGAGARVTRWTPTKVESHILITLGSRTRLPAGKWVGGEGFVEPSASVLPEGAQAPVPTSPQSGRWGDPFTTRRCQSAFRPRAPGLPLNVVLWEVPRSTPAPALRGLTSGPGDGALTLEPRGTRPAPGPRV